MEQGTIVELVDPRPVVLVVDDDEAVRRCTGRVLSSAGYDTIEVGSGLEALRAARSTRVDLVVLDIGLPDLDGYEVSAVLDRGPHPVPVLYVSGGGLDTARGVGAGFLAKPMPPAALVEAVRGALADWSPAAVALLEERDRIARELHDRVVRRLFQAALSMRRAAGMAAPVDAAVEELDAVIRDVRTVAFELQRSAMWRR